MKKVFLALLFVTLLPLTSYAIQTGTVTLHYDEPVSNADGSSLTDLHHVTIYYFANNVPVKSVDVPATALTGGGTNVTATAPYSVADGIVSVSFYATAVDTSGNESARSNVVKKSIVITKPRAPLLAP